MKVGFVGLGVMGRPMATRLLRAGFPLTVHDCVPSQGTALAERGASLAASPAEVMSASDAMICMLPDTPDVEQVLFGGGGACDGRIAGKTIIDMSTISPRASEEFALRLAGLGCQMLDAPVSGGEQGAAAGMLAIMVGGRRDIFGIHAPIFHALGSSVVYAGGPGAGQKTKLVNQVVGALNLLATIEGLRLARAGGLNLPSTLEVVSAGAASSWMLSNLGPKMVAGDFSPGFRIRLQHKDLRLAREWIAGMGLELPGVSLICTLLDRAIALGLGEQGNQGLYNLWREEARSA